jgi:lysophospholipase L1-like esterase
MSKLLKLLFTLSVTCNLIAIYFGIRKLYLSSHSIKFNDVIYDPLDRRTIYNLLPIKENQIVFAGDSQFQYYDTQEFFPGYTIINRGIAGDNTTGLISRLDAIFTAKPKILVLEIGFNDLTHDGSLDDIISNYAIIINKMKKISPSTKLIFLSVMPSNAYIFSVSVKPLVPKLNNGLKKLCAENNVLFIDLYNTFSDNGDLKKNYRCIDGIHLNGNGYVILTRAIKPFLD